MRMWQSGDFCDHEEVLGQSRNLRLLFLRNRVGQCPGAVFFVPLYF